MFEILSNVEDEYEQNSKEASTVIRGLALSAVAIIWLYAGGLGLTDKFQDTVSSLAGDKLVLIALALAFLTLFLDVLQYVISTIILQRYRSVLRKLLAVDRYALPIPDDLIKEWRSFFGVRVAWSIAEVYLNGRTEGGQSTIGPENSDQAIAYARAALLELSAESLDGDTSNSSNLTDFLNSPVVPTVLLSISSRIFYLKILSLLFAYGFLLFTVLQIFWAK